MTKFELKKSHKIVLAVVGVFALGWLLFAGFWALLSFLVGCSNEIKSEVFSPDDKLKAVVFNRGCGATVGENRQIYVCEKNQSLPDDGGNVFIEDGNHSYDPNVLKTIVKWVGPRELSVSYSKNARTFKQKENAQISTGFFQKQNIKVTYHLLPSS